MSEENTTPSALMSALYDAAETDTPIIETQPTRSRSLGEILREEPAAEPAPNPIKMAEPKPAVGQRQVDLQPTQPTQPTPAQLVQPVRSVQPAPVQPVRHDPEDGLMPEQRERLRLARIAEQMYREDPAGSPPEYNGLYDRYLSHYKEESGYVQKQLATGESLEWDDDYKALQEKAPDLSDTMIRKLEREDIKRDVSRDLNKQKREIASLKDQLHRHATTPKVDRTLRNYQKENYETSVPEEMRKAIDEDREGFKKSNPFEYEAINRSLTSANSLISQFEKVNNGLEVYNSGKHRRLADQIETLGQAHKKRAKARSGKTFVTRAEFAKLQSSQKASHYTWGADDVKKAFMASTKASISKKVKVIKEKVSQYNGSGEPVSPAKEILPTPKTATPRTPAPSTRETSPEETQNTLSSMLLD